MCNLHSVAAADHALNNRLLPHAAIGSAIWALQQFLQIAQGQGACNLSTVHLTTCFSGYRSDACMRAGGGMEGTYSACMQCCFLLQGQACRCPGDGREYLRYTRVVHCTAWRHLWLTVVPTNMQVRCMALIKACPAGRMLQL
jgi:hypothetical protein